MKRLFNQNLSHQLPRRLANLFPNSDHVRPLAFDQLPDDQSWEFAKAHGFCIVTQESDFSERSRLYSTPPEVVWLRCGDSTPQQVEAMPRGNAILITELIQNPVLHYVEIV